MDPTGPLLPAPGGTRVLRGCDLPLDHRDRRFAWCGDHLGAVAAAGHAGLDVLCSRDGKRAPRFSFRPAGPGGDQPSRNRARAALRPRRPASLWGPPPHASAHRRQRMLAAADRDLFRSHGYLWLHGFFTEAETRDLRSWTDEIAAWPETPGRWMRYYERDAASPERKLLARI